MRLWITTLCVAIGVTLCSPHMLHADTAAEMLEKGIYNEETVGNLDEAIKMYRKVVDIASETERLAAKAQFRLAQCLLKQKKKEDAVEAFKTLVAKYPDQKELVAKAKQHLPNELRLSKAPWKDGERLTLTMKLAGGQTIGIIGLAVDSDNSNGRDVWKMAVRRFVSEGQNEGVSMVTVDKLSNRPVKTIWDHTVLGTSDAVWHDDKVVISSKDREGKPEQKEVEFDDVAYSNDQWFYGFRQLPLAVGYKVTIPIRVAFTGGSPIDLEVEIDKKEKITTPVGEFDCFRLDTNIAQTLWVADVPERYMVKFIGGGVEAELTSISTGSSPTKLENKSLGFSLSVPDGWFHYDLGNTNDNASAYRLVAPTMASAVVSVKDKTLLDSDDRESLQTWAESKIKRGKRTYKNFELRPGSMKNDRLAGAGSTTFIVDQEIQGRAFVRDIALAITDSKAVAVATAAKKSDYDKYREQFDALRKSVSVR